MKVLLLSAYAAGSHVHWQQSLQAMFPSWQWQVLSLPPRHFSWRVRGNPLYWALQAEEELARDYDLLLATSMVDLATLRGLVPKLCAIPSIVYFHENQFEYPRGKRQHSLLDAQMASIYSALAADRVVFNSAYNMQSFLTGCSSLLTRLPDRVPTGVPQLLQDKSCVLAVPCDRPAVAPDSAAGPWTPGDWPRRPLRLCWLGRFEYDKGGEGLLRILTLLEYSELDYELSVTGQQFRQTPPVFAEIEAAFGHRLAQFGYVDSRQDYGSLLAAADIVLSTSLHEFQGLAVQEAVASGCLPVVPDRLVYPELYPAQFLYEVDPEDSAVEARSATELILRLAASLRNGRVQVPAVSACNLASMTAAYARLFADTMAGQHSQ